MIPMSIMSTLLRTVCTYYLLLLDRWLYSGTFSDSSMPQCNFLIIIIYTIYHLIL